MTPRARAILAAAAIAMIGLAAIRSGWPVVVPSDHQTRGPVRLYSQDLEGCITPRAHWTHENIELDLKMDERCERTPVLGVPRVRTPPTSGLWVLRIEHPGLGLSDAHRLLVVPAWMFALLLLGVMGGIGLAARAPSRRALLALAVTLPLWAPLLYGRLAWFGAVALALGAVERLWPGRRAVACAGLLVFLEWYWGMVVNENELHGFVISASIAGGLGLLSLSRPRVSVALLCVFSLLHVTLSVYESFFLDFPAMSTLDQAGQATNVLRSIGQILRAEHLVTLLLPMMVVLGLSRPAAGCSE